MNKHIELFAYLKEKRVRLEESTLNLLIKIDEVPQKLYPYFEFSAPIINFVLTNQIYFFNYAYYSFIKRNYGVMPDEDIIKYLEMVINKKVDFLDTINSPKMPKLTGTADYLEIIKKQPTVYDMEMAIETFMHPFFRKDKEVIEEIKDAPYTDWKKIGSRQKMITIEGMKTFESLKNEMDALHNKVKNKKLYEDLFYILNYYEDYNFLRYILNIPNIEKYNDIFKILIKCENVDEYEIVSQNIKNYFIYLFYTDNLYLRKRAMEKEISADTIIAYENNCLNLYILLNELNSEISKETKALARKK